MSKIPRKNRAVFEKFKDKDLEEQVRNNYITSVTEWLNGNERSNDVPF